jgi:hypothetical protein
MTKNDLVSGQVYVAIAKDVRYVFCYNGTKYSDWILEKTGSFNRTGQFIDNAAMTHYDYPTKSEKLIFLASNTHKRYVGLEEAMKMFPQDGKVNSYNLI